MPRGAESEMIDIIKIVIIATEITLPIKQSCWCAGYGNWKTWWLTVSVWAVPTKHLLNCNWHNTGIVWAESRNANGLAFDINVEGKYCLWMKKGIMGQIGLCTEHWVRTDTCGLSILTLSSRKMSHAGLDFIAAQINHVKKYEQHLKHNFNFDYTCPFNFPIL